MNPIILSLLVLFAPSIMYSQTDIRCPSDGDARINKDQPTVYIAFERFGKALELSKQKMAQMGQKSVSEQAGNDIWLRIQNNTCWPISLRQFGMYIPERRKNETPSDWMKRWGDLENGAEAGLFYWVIKPNGQKKYAGIDAYSDVRLMPGNYLLFSVSRSHLAKDHQIEVNFNYDWEDRKNGFVLNEPTHTLNLRNYEFEEQVQDTKADGR